MVLVMMVVIMVLVMMVVADSKFYLVIRIFAVVSVVKTMVNALWNLQTRNICVFAKLETQEKTAKKANAICYVNFTEIRGFLPSLKNHISTHVEISISLCIIVLYLLL